MSTTNDSANNSSQQQDQTPGSTQTPDSQTPSASDLSTPTDSGSTDLGSDSETPTDGTDLGSEDETPPADAEAAAPPAYFGVPETGTYADFTLPDGATADPVLQESFTGLAKELGLNQEGAQKLVDYKSQIDQHQIKLWGNHLTELKSLSQSDPVVGGANYTPAVAAGRASIAKFMSGPAPAEGQLPEAAAFRKMLNDYGVGAHPLMIRYMSRVGAAMGETPAIGNGGGAGVVDRPLHELMYKDDK